MKTFTGNRDCIVSIRGFKDTIRLLSAATLILESTVATSNRDDPIKQQQQTPDEFDISLAENVPLSLHARDRLQTL